MRVLMVVVLVTAGLVLAVGAAAWWLAAEQVDRRLNRVAADPQAPEPSEAVRALHRSLFIVDLHADTLKWERDLLQRGEWGHVDLPRLAEGNVALQVFTIVTKSPLPYAFSTGLARTTCVRGDTLNTAAVVAALQGRPVFSLRERALYQIRRFEEAVARSRARDGPELRPILDVEDLRRLVEDRRAGENVIGGLLGIEGGHWVGDPDEGPGTVDADMRQLFDRGVRLFAPVHRFDNRLSGSSEGCERDGLTEDGHRALRRAQALGMAVDLAHISSAGYRDAVAMLEQPFLVSHTGIEAGCEDPCVPARNLSDEQIALALRHDGLIGVGYWPQAVGPSVWRITEVMAYIMDMAAAMDLDPGRNVALGSDYDGSVVPFFDASELAILTATMRRRDEPFDERAIRHIAGLNACRLFARVLPGGSDAAADEICGTAQEWSVRAQASSNQSSASR